MLNDQTKKWRKHLKDEQAKKNKPNHHDMKGSRIFVKASVGEVKRFLKRKKLNVNSVRVSATHIGYTEVIHTQYKRYPTVYVLLRANFEIM